MNISRRETLVLIGTGAAMAALPSLSFAQDAAPVVHEIKMLNKATDDPKKIMVFEPDLVRAKVGDSVKFIPTDKSHSANSMKDMIPEGAEAFKTAINEEYTYTLTTDGAYGVQCTPHMTMGMVMLVLVGDVSGNLDAVKEVRQRGKAKERFDDIFARADALLAAETAAG